MMKIFSMLQTRFNSRDFMRFAQFKPILTFTFLVIFLTTPSLSAHASRNSEAGAVKWHPGHYYTLMGGKNNPQYLSQVYRELENTPALRGVQIRYEWIDLEPSEGAYDFSQIEQRLRELSERKKRLIVLLQIKSFDASTQFIPDYLKDKKYEEGAFPFSSYGTQKIRGYNLKLWNVQLQNRLVALITELGKRFNTHPYFEGIGLTETAMGKPMIELSKNQENSFYSGMLLINQELRTHFPNTMTYQFTNYPRPMLKSFVNRLREIGTGLGGPDTFPDDPGLTVNRTNAPKGVYHHYSELSGIVPLTPSVMQTNYVNTRPDKSGKTPTVEELLAYARDNLKANYIFWTRAPGYFPNVLQTLRSLPADDPTGGLSTVCPRVYHSCVE